MERNRSNFNQYQMKSPEVVNPLALFEAPKAPSWFSEPSNIDKYVAWRHTPLNPYGGESLMAKSGMESALLRLVDNPPAELVDEDVKELVGLDLDAGLAHRITRNAGYYSKWRTECPDEVVSIEHNPELKWLLGEALSGYGTVGGLLKFLQNAPSFQAVDLQVLSMPYGYRLEQSDGMYEELNQALGDEVFQAKIYDQPRAIEGHPAWISFDPLRRTSKDGSGILATLKHRIAELPDKLNPDSSEPIYVVERQTWLIPTSERYQFSQEILDTMRQTPDWQYSMPAFAEETERYILDRAATPGESVPLSVMTYAHRAKK